LLQIVSHDPNNLQSLPAMKSIRVFLAAIILAVITLFNFVATLKGYQSSTDETYRLFDRLLLDKARLIAYSYADNTAKF
jgi:hypothetical protein